MPEKEFICMVCGKTVSKRQSLFIEKKNSPTGKEGRACRLHDEAIRQAEVTANKQKVEACILNNPNPLNVNFNEVRGKFNAEWVTRFSRIDALTRLIYDAKDDSVKVAMATSLKHTIIDQLVAFVTILRESLKEFCPVKNEKIINEVLYIVFGARIPEEALALFGANIDDIDMTKPELEIVLGYTKCEAVHEVIVVCNSLAERWQNLNAIHRS